MVFVHGVIENEERWIPTTRPDVDPAGLAQDFGSRLTRDLGCSCVQVRYNSGRHVSDNGDELDALLTGLVEAWPVPVRRIALVGHSMGGLVGRSAVHQATSRGRRWVHLVRHVVCLGTPHAGAALERVASRLTAVLRRYDESMPLAELLAARNAGIKVLRHGYLDRQDWYGLDPDAVDPNPDRAAYRFPPAVRHGDVAATLSHDPSSWRGRVFGDLLVRPDSALDREHSVHIRQIGGLSHRDLLTHHEIYRQLRDWLRR